MRADNTLILFAKTPQICRVKTRMHPALTHRECLYLHRKLTMHAINQLQSYEKFKLIIYTTHIDKARHLLPRGIEVKQQLGIGLGTRMHHAIKQEIKNSQRVVLIGSDFLTLDINYIYSAFRELSKINDIVLGPTIDGGYGLIGMQKHNRFLFKNIPWGTSKVFEETKVSALQRGRKIKLLDGISDMDAIDDLHRFGQLNMLPSWANNLIKKSC
jgi:rSAM/selenodomain-associated transferase 1